jgi:hypothetical protein
MTHWNALGLAALAVIFYRAAGSSNASQMINPLEQSHEYQKNPHPPFCHCKRLQ